jgi:hypothetical protein
VKYILNLFLLSASALASYYLVDSKVILKSKATSQCKPFFQSSEKRDFQIKSRPCDPNTVQTILADIKFYPQIVLDEVSEFNKKIEISLKKKPKTQEEIETFHRRLKELQEKKEIDKKLYPRFGLKEGSPDDYKNFGIHTGDYSDAQRFLGQRTCTNSNLFMASEEESYLSLFFSLNSGRHFGGIIRIINERIVTLVEGSLFFEKNEHYFTEKRIPQGTFRSWVHEDIERDYKGFVYQEQIISQVYYSWRNNFFNGPWLYNSCNKSISVIHNNCSLDPSMDMELKDFFYLTKLDVMIGNIYCKKSSDPSWTRIATMEFIRI